MDLIESKYHRKWLGEYLVNCRHNNKSEKTLLSYGSDLKRFICWLEFTQKISLYQVKAATISAYLKYLEGSPPCYKKNFYEILFFWLKFPIHKKEYLEDFRPLSVGSKRRHLSSLNNFFSFLIQNYEDKTRKFKTNPVKPKIHSIKVKDKDVNSTTYLPDHDWESILSKTIRVRDKLILALMYYGGLRLEEVVNLDLSHFSFTKKSIKFVRKGGYVHELVPENSHVIFDYLYKWLQIRTFYGEPLFLTKQGKRISKRGAYSLVMQAIKRADCTTKGLSPHSFRKACATGLYKKTKDLLYVRDYLNHKDAKVTQGYIEMV